MANIWFPFYLADYAAKADFLTQGQHGAYLCLLRWYYTHRQPVPFSLRYQISKSHAPSERKNCDVVIERFFTRDGDLLRSSKADEVCQHIENVKEERRLSGKKGGRPKKQLVSENKANGIANQKQNHKQNETQSQSQLHTKKEVSEEELRRYGMDDKQKRIGEALAKASTPAEAFAAVSGRKM